MAKHNRGAEQEERQRQEQLAGQQIREQQQKLALAQQAAYEKRRQQDALELWSLLALPLVLGGLVAGFRPSFAVKASGQSG